jgi:outer membrane receptor protein involved in Fe transport
VFLFPYDEAGTPSASTIDGFFANIDRTRREGIELSSRVALGPLDVQANYAWTYATFQVEGIEIFSIREEAGGENEVERGDRLPLVPEHVASMVFSLELPRGLMLGIEGRYTGERYLRGDEANGEAPLDDYLLADATLGLRFRAWEFQATVRNLTDVDHATFGTFNLNHGAGNALERFLSPGSPRTFQLVVRRGIGR